MIVVGGANGGPGRVRDLRDGAAYDPRADRWVPIAVAPLAPTESTRAVWTGQEMIVWTGSAGAAYDPRRDR